MYDPLQFALGQLDRLAGFFPRVDGKAAGLFALDAGLLTVVALNFPYREAGSLLGIVGAFAAVLASLSLVHVYRAFFPDLRGGGVTSLIYFGDVGQLAPGEYVDRLRAVTPDELLEDAANQAWRNSEILRLKYAAVANGFALTAMAILPWLLFLVGTGLTGGEIELGG